MKCLHIQGIKNLKNTVLTLQILAGILRQMYLHTVLSGIKRQYFCRRKSLLHVQNWASLSRHDMKTYLMACVEREDEVSLHIMQTNKSSLFTFF